MVKEMRAYVWIVLLLLWPLVAHAEDPVSGFSTEGTGVIKGEVTDENGAPLSGVAVHANTQAGERTTTTDRSGRYQLDLGEGEGPKFVYVRMRARINGHTQRTAYEEGEEYVDILEADKPSIMPKPTTATNLVLAYSSEVKDANAWVRAWLVLDVTASGFVRRLKLINRPGYALDELAVREAFKLRFAPARSRAGKAVPAMVLWTYEWPSYWWMIEQKLDPRIVPESAAKLPCKGTASTERTQRDCSQADLAAAQLLPWIDAPSIPDIAPPPPVAVQEPVRYRWYHDRTGWLVTGTGAALSTIAAYLLISAYQDEDEALALPITNASRAARLDAVEQRKTTSLVLGAAGVLALGLGVTRLVLHDDGTTTTVSLATRF